MDNTDTKIFIEANKGDLKVEVNGSPAMICFFLGQVIVDMSKTSGVSTGTLCKMIVKSIQVWSED